MPIDVSFCYQNYWMRVPFAEQGGVGAHTHAFFNNPVSFIQETWMQSALSLLCAQRYYPHVPSSLLLSLMFTMQFAEDVLMSL